jgi:hypothetical protein
MFYLFVAVVVLSDLEKMLVQMNKLDYSFYRRQDCKSTLEMKKWRLFLVSLMHHRLTKIHLPSKYYWQEGIILEFVHLLDEIGAKCPALRLLKHKANFWDDPPDMKQEKDFRLKEAFFRALPKLLNLQVVKLYFFRCDDWALQQFGQFGTNIV